MARYAFTWQDRNQLVQVSDGRDCNCGKCNSISSIDVGVLLHELVEKLGWSPFQVLAAAVEHCGLNLESLEDGADKEFMEAATRLLDESGVRDDGGEGEDDDDDEITIILPESN